MRWWTSGSFNEQTWRGCGKWMEGWIRDTPSKRFADDSFSAWSVCMFNVWCVFTLCVSVFRCIIIVSPEKKVSRNMHWIRQLYSTSIVCVLSLQMAFVFMCSVSKASLCYKTQVPLRFVHTQLLSSTQGRPWHMKFRISGSLEPQKMSLLTSESTEQATTPTTK